MAPFRDFRARRSADLISRLISAAPFVVALVLSAVACAGGSSAIPPSAPTAQAVLAVAPDQTPMPSHTPLQSSRTPPIRPPATPTVTLAALPSSPMPPTRPPTTAAMSPSSPEPEVRSPVPPTSTPTPTVAPYPLPTSPPTATPEPHWDRLRFVPALGGQLFALPVELFPWPDGGLAIAEKTGEINLFVPGMPASGLLDLGTVTSADLLETGLLSVATDPAFDQDDCKVRWHCHRGGRWSGWGGRRSFWLAGAWTSGRGTIRPGAGRSARCSPGWRIPRPTPTPQRVDVLIPTAVLHVMQAVLNTPVLAEQFKQFLWSAAPGTQAGQQVPALPANLPSGYIHPLLLHHGPLPRPGEPQFIPDVAGQQVIGPDPPPLDHTRFFSRVSACGSPSSSGANPSVSAASTVGWFPLTRTR